MLQSLCILGLGPSAVLITRRLTLRRGFQAKMEQTAFRFEIYCSTAKYRAKEDVFFFFKLVDNGYFYCAKPQYYQL